jgi:prepilin-type N-terminal cleavage/methylation domain-containing protein
MKKNLGFTLLEIMVAVSIMTLLITVVSASISGARSRARNAQVKSEKQNIILALVRAREASPTYTYPGVTGWQCLKPSGTCWKGAWTGNSTITNALTPYMPGGVIPIPPWTDTNQHRTGGYLYSPYIVNFVGVTGPVLVWSQENQINTADCNGATFTSIGAYYCAELLPR